MSENKTDAFTFHDLNNGWGIGRFTALDELDNVVHMITTRRGPAIQDAKADAFLAAGQVASVLGLNRTAYTHQVHGDVVLCPAGGGLTGEGDALMTHHASMGLMGFSADCPLVLLADPFSGVVGMAHASWRGTSLRVSQKLVVAMVSRYGVRPNQITACIGPSAGPCCYEVGDDCVGTITDRLGDDAKEFFTKTGEKITFDLWAANRSQLKSAGVPAEQIHVANVCTICRNDLFPSYRVEGDAAGRFVAVIGLR